MKNKRVEGYKHGQVPKALREKQILDIAEKQFIESGYNDTTIESVRLEAGISRAIIYNYYGSKERLYLACVKRASDEFEILLEDLWREVREPRELLVSGSEIYYGTIEKNPKRWAAFFGGSTVPMTGELGEGLTKIKQSSIDQIASKISAFQPQWDDVAVDAFANCFSAIGEQMGRWWLRNPKIPKTRIVELHIAFLGGALGLTVPYKGGLSSSKS